MGRDNIIAVTACEAQHAAEKETTLEGRFRAAMASTAQAYLTTDDGERLTAACVAVAALSPPEDVERIRVEMDMLRALARGDGRALLDPLDKGFKPIGIMKMWREIAEKEGR